MYRYKTGIDFINDEIGGIRSASNILVLAPPLTNAKEIAYLLSKPVEGEYSIILSTDDRSNDVLDNFKRYNVEGAQLGVIDSITKSSTPSITDTKRVKFVSSPMDLTNIGIQMSKIVQVMWEDAASAESQRPMPPPMRFCMNSVSTLLIYIKLEVLFRFIQVWSAKVKKLEGLGIYYLNSGSFDAQTISTIQQLMDGMIEIKTVDDGDMLNRHLRIQGIEDMYTPWMKFGFKNGMLEVER